MPKLTSNRSVVKHVQSAPLRLTIIGLSTLEGQAHLAALIPFRAVAAVRTHRYRFALRWGDASILYPRNERGAAHVIAVALTLMEQLGQLGNTVVDTVGLTEAESAQVFEALVAVGAPRLPRKRRPRRIVKEART